ncbi:GNAT family N-acetyltransferase [Frateuria defendens]|uniref:GNAT family N-acetyltransferase n=1 Tax=Frateuria defendens TaxID=2219559 RepID=UPI00069D0F51|nr:GNAT family protein [Frateuria defendens]
MHATPHAPIALELPVAALRLRCWRPEDAPALYAAVDESREVFRRWLPWCRDEYAEADAATHIATCRRGWEDGTQYSFGAFDEGGVPLAAIGLDRFTGDRGANLGYWVRRSRQGQGLCPLLVRAVAHFAFETLQRVRVEIVVAAGNQASRRAAEKSGARLEGIARQRLLLDGQAHDAAVYALIPSDLEG